MPISLPTPPRVPGLVLGTSAFAAGDVAWRSPGATNLLTTNQASLETDTTGWQSGARCSIARSTAQAASGSASLAVTANATGASAGYMNPETVPSAGSWVPVVGGRLYTVVASTRAATVARNFVVSATWYTSGGAFISGSNSATIAGSTSAWVEGRLSAVAPATAAYATISVVFYSVADAEVHYIDRIGLWEGPGGTWALPGEPIQGLGTYVDESVGRRVFTWDPINSRWQMTYGDTGWRDVSAGLLNSWSAGAFRLRRVGQTVTLAWQTLTKASASSDEFYVLPTGFTPPFDVYGFAATQNGAYKAVGGYLRTSGLASAIYRAAFDGGINVSHGGVTFQTADAWPSSLPGSASGSIPSS